MAVRQWRHLLARRYRNVALRSGNASFRQGRVLLSYRVPPGNDQTSENSGGTPRRMKELEVRGELEKHHESAYGWALYCCGRDREQALDVLQTVYVKVLDGKARFNGRSAFRTWLFALVRNTAADQRRSWLRRFWREAQPMPVVEAAAPGTSAAERERALAIEQALAKVSGRQREVLHLAFYQGMTLEEAAEVMGITVGSARTHYERGKAKLREVLGGKR